MPTNDRSRRSVWARDADAGRSTLDRDQIVRAAIGLLDDEGIDRLSMRNLAARLGSGTATLYWHVANRDELIQLVVNELYGEIELPEVDESGDWQTAMRRLAHEMRAAILRHPWTVGVLDHLVGDSFGPNVVQLTERLLVLFEQAGFELREAERAMNTVAAYVMGIATTEAAWRATAYTSGQDQEARAEEVQRLAYEATEHAPRFRELLGHYEDVDVDDMTDQDFAYGLERVLDGLQARLDVLGRG